MNMICSQRLTPQLLVLAGCLILMVTVVYLAQDVFLVRIKLPVASHQSETELDEQSANAVSADDR